jgi:hypothetical protein
VDRLDHGNWRHRHIENMTDDQLWQAIASHMPDPSAFFDRLRTMDYDQQGELLRSLRKGEMQ